MSGIATAVIVGGIAAAGSVASAAISSHAAGEAAKTQAGAAESAAQLQATEAQNSLNFQEQEWNTQQQNLAPWLSAGKAGLSQLQTDLGVGGNKNAPGYGSLTTPFQAPTAAQAAAQPGYQFQQQQGQQAIQNSAAAKGNLVSGNDMEALNNYGQQTAQSDYNNVYNQSFNTFESNQLNQYNRLAALSGVGQQAGATLGSEGQAAAGTVANIDLTAGAQQGQDYQNAAAAEASGYVGQANAWSGALSGTSNNLVNMALLNSMYGGNGGQASAGAQAAANASNVTDGYSDGLQYAGM